MLYLTGNVTTFRMASSVYPGLRQYGFQETPIVQMVAGITKYAVLVTKAQHVVPELKRAVAIAKTARMGPVLVDICDDVQRAEI